MGTLPDDFTLLEGFYENSLPLAIQNAQGKQIVCPYKDKEKKKHPTSGLIGFVGIIRLRNKKTFGSFHCHLCHRNFSKKGSGFKGKFPEE